MAINPSVCVGRPGWKGNNRRMISYRACAIGSPAVTERLRPSKEARAVSHMVSISIQFSNDLLIDPQHPVAGKTPSFDTVHPQLNTTKTENFMHRKLSRRLRHHNRYIYFKKSNAFLFNLYKYLNIYIKRFTILC